MSKSQAMRSLREFFRNERGATAIEYALIASAIAGAIIVVVMAMGTQLASQVPERFRRLQLSAGGIRAAASRRRGFPACRAHRPADARLSPA